MCNYVIIYGLDYWVTGKPAFHFRQE